MHGLHTHRTCELCYFIMFSTCSYPYSPFAYWLISGSWMCSQQIDCRVSSFLLRLWVSARVVIAKFWERRFLHSLPTLLLSAWHRDRCLTSRSFRTGLPSGLLSLYQSRTSALDGHDRPKPIKAPSQDHSPPWGRLSVLPPCSCPRILSWLWPAIGSVHSKMLCRRKF